MYNHNLCLSPHTASFSSIRLSYGWSLVRTTAVVFRAHLDNLGCSHREALNLITFGKNIFQIRSHPQVLGVWMQTYLLGSQHSTHYRELGLVGPEQQFLCILYAVTNSCRVSQGNNIVWFRLLNSHSGYGWELTEGTDSEWAMRVRAAWSGVAAARIKRSRKLRIVSGGSNKNIHLEITYGNGGKRNPKTAVCRRPNPAAQIPSAPELPTATLHMSVPVCVWRDHLHFPGYS